MLNPEASKCSVLCVTACNALHILGITEMSLCLSHSWALSKRCKLRSWNLYCELPKWLVFVTKFCVLWVMGFPSKDEYLILPLFAHLVCKQLQRCTDMLLIITSTGDKLLRGINISDLEWPWTSKIRGFSDFFTFLSCNTHFKSKLHQKGWRQNQDNLQMKFSALNVDFGSSKYQLHKFKEVCAHGHQRGISS